MEPIRRLVKSAIAHAARTWTYAAVRAGITAARTTGAATS